MTASKNSMTIALIAWLLPILSPVNAASWTYVGEGECKPTTGEAFDSFMLAPMTLAQCETAAEQVGIAATPEGPGVVSITHFSSSQGCNIQYNDNSLTNAQIEAAVPSSSYETFEGVWGGGGCASTSGCQNGVGPVAGTSSCYHRGGPCPCYEALPTDTTTTTSTTTTTTTTTPSPTTAIPTSDPTSDPTRDPTTAIPTSDPTSDPTAQPTTDMYLRVDEHLSRDDADARCDELFGTHLASIHSQFENDEAYELCAQDRPSSTSGVFSGCWIGFYFDGATTSIGWTDKSTVEYANWRDGAPNSDAHYNFIMVNTDDSQWEDAASSFPDSITRFLCNAPSASPTLSPTATFHYVAAGNMYSDHLDTAVALSCEKDTNNQGTYGSSTFGFDINVACCDDSVGSRPGCVSVATYQEAFDVCDVAGLRLCTAIEVVSKKTKGTGCHFDRAYTWTSTECDASDSQDTADPARSVDRKQDPGYDAVASDEQEMSDAQPDTLFVDVLVAALVIFAVAIIAVLLFRALSKKKKKMKKMDKAVADLDEHVASSSVEMSTDAPRSTAAVYV